MTAFLLCADAWGQWQYLSGLHGLVSETTGCSKGSEADRAHRRGPEDHLPQHSVALATPLQGARAWSEISTALITELRTNRRSAPSITIHTCVLGLLFPPAAVSVLCALCYSEDTLTHPATQDGLTQSPAPPTHRQASMHLGPSSLGRRLG